MGFDYKKAGVDVEAGDSLVEWLQNEDQNKSSKLPFKKNLLEGIGGFASLFRMDFPQYKKPCLITCTDGVGTKVKIASHFQSFEGVAQDLVAMCVNDLICTGGEPLLFLDYYAVGELHLPSAQSFLTGLKKACEQSECLLVGGETAEMPGVYQKGDFDCAGFAVGIVDEDLRWGAHQVQSKDVLVGVSSSGFHSNGYSLLRKVFENDLDKWKDTLLTPTALYVKPTKKIKSQQIEVHAAAHITGGGTDNIPRVLPEGKTWKAQTWEWPEPFREVQRRTGMSDEKMLTTLNCGIGFVFVVPAPEKEKIHNIIQSEGFKSFNLGEVV